MLNNTEPNKFSSPSLVAQMVGMERINERIKICTSRERKAACVLALILSAFILCWLPFFLNELLVGFKVLQPSPQLSLT